MKRWLAAALLLLFLIPVSRAQEPYTPLTPEEYSQWKESLPSELAGEAEKWMGESTGIPDTGSIFSILWEKTAASLRSSWPSAAALMTGLLGILLGCAVFSGCGQGLLGSPVFPAWELCSTLCLSVTLAQNLRGLTDLCGNYLDRMSTLLNGVTPAVCAITAASGHLSTASVGRASMMLVYTILQNVYSAVLFPAVKLSFCFGIVGGISSGVRVDALSRLVRRIFLWMLAGLGVLLSFIVGTQTCIARSADSLTMRTVRFALSSFIPLVGSSLAEALGTAAGSLNVIRSSCGILSAAAVLLYLLPAAAQLILYRLVLSLCQGAAEMIGCEREGKLIGEMHGVLGYMLAVISVSSLLFLFVLTLMIGVSGGG